jgi:peroxiredoxin
MGGQQLARAFTRPGVAEGGIERINVDSAVGESVVVLVFYPSDFGPQSGQSAALLRAVGEVTDGTDTAAYGVAPESPHSHERFAAESDIGVPLVSDADGSLAEAYGVATTGEGGQPLAERSLFVLDYRGVVVDEWVADHAGDMPDFDRLRRRLESITPDHSARGCYRTGYARYREGRRYLSSGFEHCEDGDWGLAASAFDEACEQFGEATNRFTKGQGLADEAAVGERNGTGRVTATTYWEAAEWLAGFATAAGKGNAETREESRTAAEEALQKVRDVTLPEPETAPQTRTDDDVTA